MTAEAKKDKYQKLRQQAETYLRMQSQEESDSSAFELHQLIHNLRVYQIELEIQNEELRKTQRNLEISNDRYNDLYDFAPVGYLTIDSQGLILEANLTATSMLGSDRIDLLNKNLHHFIAPEDQDNYYLCRRFLFKSKKLHACEIKMAKNDGSFLQVQMQGIVEKNDHNHARIAIIDMSEQLRVKAELVKVRGRLAEIREMAHQHLARELHDQVVQQLIGLRYQLIEARQYATSLASSSDAQGYQKLATSFKSFDQQVLNVTKELRRVISNLRPAGLEELGLTAALEGYLAQAQRENRDLWLNYKLDKSGRELPYRVALCLFRVAQEAVRNALKHAAADEITVRLQLNPMLARLEVSDDGKGFKMPTRLAELARHEHFGLIGIAERVELVNGHLTISSTPQSGTYIMVQIPLNRKENKYEQ